MTSFVILSGLSDISAVILSGEPMSVLFWFMMTSPIKLNVVYSLTPLGSESKPEERGTSDEGASLRADLLGEGTPKH